MLKPTKCNIFELVSGQTILGEDNECLLPDSDKRFELNGDTKSITFSYSVNWEASTIRWASRWDAYLAMGDVQIHWFSVGFFIINFFEDISISRSNSNGKCRADL